VLNVVDFGCFVDIGMHDSGLVHVSRLADKFVRDPHDVVAVGDIVKVWVTEVDKERRRVSLTMVKPGQERPKPQHNGGRPERQHPSGEGAPQGEGRGQQRRPPRPQGQQQQRPPRPAGQQDQRPPRPAGQQDQRPPRSDGDRRPPRSQGGSYGRGRPQHDQHRPVQQPRPTPKPLIPITEAMKKGKEPLRTFSDLMQFYQHKTAAPEENQPQAATEQTPTGKVETPVETPVVHEDTSPIKEDVPTVADEAPGIQEQLPLGNEETPVISDEVPIAGDQETV